MKMGITSRLLPLNGTPQTANIGAGAGTPILRSYSATGGGFIDALGDPSCDASVLVSQGFILVGGSGTTAQRPNGAGFQKPGFLYVDVTLGLAVVWDGMNWRNPVTGATA
jgi:hypothetical protein